MTLRSSLSAGSSRSPMRNPVRWILSRYAGPMPRPVVPMLWRLSFTSRSSSIRMWYGMSRAAPAATNRRSAHLEPAFLEAEYLVPQRPGIDDHPAAQQAPHAFVQDPRRDQVQDVLLRTDMDRVARIGATLVAQHPVHIAAEGVDDLAFALVAPLAADDHPIAH